MSITYEPTDEQREDPLTKATELEKRLIILREEKFPISQELSRINHEIEQIKSQIKILNHEYWSKKG